MGFAGNMKDIIKNIKKTKIKLTNELDSCMLMSGSG